MPTAELPFASKPNVIPTLMASNAVMLTVFLLLASTASVSTPAVAQTPQDVDPDEAIPGLSLELRSGDTVLRQSTPRPVLQTAAGRLDPRLLPAGTCELTGQLLVRTAGPHRFHVQLCGDVSLFIDGQPVLEVSGENRFFSSNPVILSGGEHSLRIKYTAPTPIPAAANPSGNAVPIAQPEGSLQVYWSSPDFTLEPLPADVLSHLPTSASEQAMQQSVAGRFLTDALRCGACHAGWSEGPVVPAPNLTDAISWLTDEQVAARLLPGSRNSAMPHFNFTTAEAADVIAFLRASENTPAAKPTVPTPPAFKPGDEAAGEKLLLTTGCAACHTVDPQVSVDIGPWRGPDLNGGGQIRDAAWLLQWLKSPQTLNRNHRMPVFELNDDERRQLVAALLRRQSTSSGQATSNKSDGSGEPPLPTGDAQRGQILVKSAGCTACHAIKDLGSPTPRPFRPWPADGVRIPCLDRRPSADAAATDALRAPTYSLNDAERQQLARWLSSVSQPLPTAAGHHLGQLLLQRRSCLACHDRDGGTGLSNIAAQLESRREDLRGQAQALIPPELTAVGDRLRDEVLQEAVGGGVERRLPWLLVRMPRFSHAAPEREALVQLLISEDRIPDAADPARQELFEYVNPQHPTLATHEDLYSGNQLAGAGGFQCTACHKAGPWEPRNVALGTRGSDLMLMGRRLRPRYFLRWMHNPIRVVSGIEMPQLRQPIDRGLNETLSQQIGQLWTALADHRFVPPTVLSRYEQMAAVPKGSWPRVIRDVFLSEGSPVGSGTPRALAVGFDNGHNLLLDLDSGRLVQWTAGEFARQRTEGKSWFWDLAGITLAAFGKASPDGEFRLQNPGNGSLLNPVRDELRTAELLSVEESSESVVVRLRLHYSLPATEDLQPTAKAAESPHSTITAWTPRAGLDTAVLQITIKALQPSSAESTAASPPATGVELEYHLESAPADMGLLCGSWSLPARTDAQNATQQLLTASNADARPVELPADAPTQILPGHRLIRRLLARLPTMSFSPPPVPPLMTAPASVDCVPGFSGERLPLPAALMPTGMAWFPDGSMVLSSLRGEVRILRDSDSDGRYDIADLFAEGLAAPYGVLVDGSDVLVSHKPELLRLRDTNGDGRADLSQVLASGWGYSDDYHDWTAGLTRDAAGNLYVGLGSDYSQNKRPADNDRWRGTILKIDPAGGVEPIAFSMRFPMGLAIDPQGQLFATDNQGVQNTFNEINHIQAGRRYGVPSRHDQPDTAPETPALQIPHPWTRSVNSLAFFPQDYPLAELRGQAVACEYDSQCLIRMSFEDVEGVIQGACYRFSRPPEEGTEAGLQGPISIGFAPDHSLCIGSLRDSGWQGARNTGCIEKLLPNGQLPNGIREIRATAEGFHVDFFQALSGDVGTRSEDWDVQSFTRVWKGSYATTDSERRNEVISEVQRSRDGRSVYLHTGGHRAGFLYELRLRGSGTATNYWPTEGFYWMKKTPAKKL
ncbi:MAG: hypothetical protein RLZZ436_4281 [Planctomycetota bacterium]